jgi:hypothetical protein
MSHQTLNVRETENFFIKISNIAIPTNLNKRITGFLFYMKKKKDEVDYEQIKYVNLMSRDQTNPAEEFYVNTLKPNGIYLNQTIGTIFNFYTHKLQTVMDDYIMANGIAYCLADNKVFYPAVSNGNISEAIFYHDSVIRNVTAKPIIRLSNIKETLAVHTKDEAKFVIAQDSGIGEFLFAIKDAAGYGVQNRYAVEESPDGVFILTKQGIFLTTVQDDVPLSAEINDIVEANYASARLLYDSVNKELWFYIENNNEICVYNFVHRKWATRELVTAGSGGPPPIVIEKMFINDNGEVIVTLDNGSLQKIVESDFGIAVVQTHEIDFGDIESLKQFQYQMVDYQGTVKFGTDERTSGYRTETKYSITVDKRYPVKKIYTGVQLINSSKLYAIEMSYDLVYTIR